MQTERVSPELCVPSFHLRHRVLHAPFLSFQCAVRAIIPSSPSDLIYNIICFVSRFVQHLTYHHLCLVHITSNTLGFPSDTVLQNVQTDMSTLCSLHICLRNELLPKIIPWDHRENNTRVSMYAGLCYLLFMLRPEYWFYSLIVLPPTSTGRVLNVLHMICQFTRFHHHCIHLVQLHHHLQDGHEGSMFVANLAFRWFCSQYTIR